MKALSSKATLLRPMSQTTTLRTPEIFQEQRDDDLAISEGKTTEEILLEDHTYSTIVQSSQLSPFMTKFAAKLFTPHNVAITTKLPEKRFIKGSKKLFQEYNLLAKKTLMTNSNHGRAQTTTKAMDHELLRLNRMEKRFERWMKQPIMTERARNEFDMGCKELKAKGIVAFDYKKMQDRAQDLRQHSPKSE